MFNLRRVKHKNIYGGTVKSFNEMLVSFLNLPSAEKKTQEKSIRGQKKVEGFEHMFSGNKRIKLKSVIGNFFSQFSKISHRQICNRTNKKSSAV